METLSSRSVLVALLATTLLAGCGGSSKAEQARSDAQQACVGTPKSLARASALDDVEAVRSAVTNVILRAKGVDEDDWTAWRTSLSGVLSTLDDLTAALRHRDPTAEVAADAKVDAAFLKLDAAANALGDGVCGSRVLGGALLDGDVRRATT